jgi:Domain of unknown function (DUF4190)
VKIAMKYPNRNDEFTRQQTASAPSSPPPAEPRKPSQHDGFAIASLVLGIVTLGGLGSLLAVIFAGVHMKQASREGRNTSGMAIAGLILGIIGLVGIVLIIILALVTSSAPAPTPIYG